MRYASESSNGYSATKTLVVEILKEVLAAVRAKDRCATLALPELVDSAPEEIGIAPDLLGH